MIRRAAFIGVVAALTLAVSAAPTFAGKGGNKGDGGPKGGGASASLSVSPDPVVAGGATYLVVGSGFTPNVIVAVQESRPYCCSSFNVLADANGGVSFTRTTGNPGTYTIQAFEKSRRKYVLKAEVSFTVSG